jgi:hypothetical protein
MVALSPTVQPSLGPSMNIEFSDGIGVGVAGAGNMAHVPTPPVTV